MTCNDRIPQRTLSGRRLSSERLQPLLRPRDFAAIQFEGSQLETGMQLTGPGLDASKRLEGRSEPADRPVAVTEAPRRPAGEHSVPRLDVLHALARRFLVDREHRAGSSARSSMPAGINGTDR